MANIPPPPPGFIVEGGNAPSGADASPPLPPGFVLDDGNPQTRYDLALAKVRQSQFPDMSDQQWSEYSQRAFSPNLQAQLDQSTTLGFADEIGAALGGFGSQVRQWTGGGGPGYGDSFGDLYELEQARLELARAQNGGWGTAAEVVAGLGTMGPARTTLGAVAAPLAAQGGNAIVNGAKAALPAVAGGAVYGFGSADGDLAERAIGAGVGGSIGAVGAAVAPVLASAGGMLIRKAANVPAWMANKAAQQGAIVAAPAASTIKAGARAAYDAAKATGAEIAPQAMNVLRTDVRALLADEGLIMPTSGRLSTAYPKVTSAVDALDEFAAGGPVSIAQAQTLLKTLRRVAGSTDPDEARIGIALVDQFENFMDGLPPSAFPKGQGTQAVKSWQKGRTEWARFRKVQTLEGVIAKANRAEAGFPAGLKTGFRQILNSPKKQRGFSADELAAMERYVQGGPLDDLAKFFGNGSSLPATITGHFMGGPAGALAMGAGRVATGMAARAGMDRGARRAAETLRAGAATPGGLPGIMGTPAANTNTAGLPAIGGLGVGIAANDPRDMLAKLLMNGAR